MHCAQQTFSITKLVLHIFTKDWRRFLAPICVHAVFTGSSQVQANLVNRQIISGSDGH